MDAKQEERKQAYWRANNRLILGLLVVWAAVSYGCGILFVEFLNRFTFFGLPFGFWIAHQGAIYVFVVLIFVYAWRMDKLDKKFHVDE
ncbi:MAG: DUF4212 domain-containing protein [Candidatus Hydrogenedentes bacterium]|nr:DUF4212 domain-containing protein [Candidatus Hydrogenedentota bacterium]